MDSNAILAEFKEVFGESLLEANRLGRLGPMSAWVETKSLRAALVLILEKAGLDWLENFSIAEMHGAFVVSYFLRSSRNSDTQFVIRAAPMGVKDNEELVLQTVRDLFASAQAFEDEATELYGVRFEQPSGEALITRRVLLGDRAPAGFPMRKSTKTGLSS